MGLFISHINTSKSTWSRAGADAQWCLQNWLLLSPNDAQNVGFPLHAYCQMVAAPTSIISASRRGAKGQRGYEPLAFQKLSQEFPWPRLCLITPLATEDSGMVRYKLGAFLGQTNADSIGKGGQSVCAKESSSQLTGPPPPFHLFCLPSCHSSWNWFCCFTSLPYFCLGEKPGNEPEEVRLQNASKQIVQNAILQAVRQVSQESRQREERDGDNRGSFQLGVGQLTKKHEKK